MKRKYCVSVRMRIVTTVRIFSCSSSKIYCVKMCLMLHFINLTFDSFVYRVSLFSRVLSVKRLVKCVFCVLIFFTSAILFQLFFSFHFFSSLYSQDLIYQSSLVRGNRKKTVQELFAFSCRPL